MVKNFLAGKTKNLKNLLLVLRRNNQPPLCTLYCTWQFGEAMDDSSLKPWELKHHFREHYTLEIDEGGQQLEIQIKNELARLNEANLLIRNTPTLELLEFSSAALQ